MIGRLTGVVLEKGPTRVMLDVAGVGYEVDIPFSTSYQLPAPGQQVVLHTHFVVREDAQLLFGFIDTQDRDLFRLLIRVNGVGPRLALAILSGLDGSQLIACVRANDAGALVKIPGIGKKTAERLLIELRDRVDRWAAAEGQSTPVGTAHQATLVDERAEAEAALVALGYKPAEAARAVRNVAQDAMSCEQMIRLALRQMVAS